MVDFPRVSLGGYPPVNEHSHGKSTILMVFTRKDGIFMGELLVSGRVHLQMVVFGFLHCGGTFWIVLRRPQLTWATSNLKTKFVGTASMRYQHGFGLVGKIIWNPKVIIGWIYPPPSNSGK